MPHSKILAIETSCDECSVSIVTEHKSSSHVEVLSNIIFSQIDLHRKFGGIVPEVASRNHLEMISPVIDEALEKAKLKLTDLTAIAVTNNPGLVGALLVGVSTAKALAYSLNIPLIEVNHLEGHVHSLFIAGQKGLEHFIDSAHLPSLICLVSGGHTNLYLLKNLPPEKLNFELIASSRDDAAGEAFDKSAKLLGLPYPGGVQMDKLAQKGNTKKYAFPRPMKGKGLDFSFSGIKTSVLLKLKEEGFEPHIWGIVDPKKLPADQVLWDYCASIQEAIVDSLTSKILDAIKIHGARSLAVVGGVSANSRLRALLNEKCNVPVFVPDSIYCTDNAAMIGACAFFKFKRNEILTGKDLLEANVVT